MKNCRLSVLIYSVVGAAMFLGAPGTASYAATPTTNAADATPLKPEELEALAAPIALYPDSLVAQIIMASTYPLEIVQADRWAKANKDVKGDALATALNKQTWDASVKSLVDFPQVLDMMSTQLDWTTKFGDAVIAEQKGMMAAIQRLRAKAKANGNLKSSNEIKVSVETPPATVSSATTPSPEVIVIESSSPSVVYVPTYNPTVVYGAWPYPAYPPPPPYYPPGFVVGSNLISFGVGVAVGAAWGHAWGGCDWRGGDINIDVDRNINLNRNIDRNSVKAQFNNTNIGNSGNIARGNTFRHDPAHRKGVAYRDQATAQRMDRTRASNIAAARNDFRGHADAGRLELGGASRGGLGGGGLGDHAGMGGNHAGAHGLNENRAGAGNGSLFNGVDRGGTAARTSSSRGETSRLSSPSHASAIRSAPHVAPRPAIGARGGGRGRR